jgi:uncharacterized membrane protein YhaH (DUF805 family)
LPLQRVTGRPFLWQSPAHHSPTKEPILLTLAEFKLSDALLTTLSIFFLIVLLWILITILSDLFNDHELSGWSKALWVLVLILIPMLGSLAYLIFRGHGMRERAVKHQAEVKQHFDQYIRSTAGGGSAAASPVDELAKLNDLKTSGAISDEEYAKLKAKLID